MLPHEGEDDDGFETGHSGGLRLEMWRAREGGRCWSGGNFGGGIVGVEGAAEVGGG